MSENVSVLSFSGLSNSTIKKENEDIVAFFNEKKKAQSIGPGNYAVRDVYLTLVQVLAAFPPSMLLEYINMNFEKSDRPFKRNKAPLSTPAVPPLSDMESERRIEAAINNCRHLEAAKYAQEHNLSVDDEGHVALAYEQLEKDPKFKLMLDRYYVIKPGADMSKVTPEQIANFVSI